MAPSPTLAPVRGADVQAPSTALENPRFAGLWHIAGLWHLTSLDAPTVAVVWSLAFAQVAKVHLPLWLLAVLGLSAWAFYIADRLFDVRRSNGTWHTSSKAGALQSIRMHGNLQARHHFHWRHRRIFVPLGIGAGIAALALVCCWMPLAARGRNSVLAAAALAYFTSVHGPNRPTRPRIRLPKELLVGILFTLACALPVLSRMADGRLKLAPMMLCFIALAWLNCWAIERWESPTEAPSSGVLRLAMLLCAITVALGVLVGFQHHPRQCALLAAAGTSSALLALLDKHNKMEKRQHQAQISRPGLTPTALRAAADLALLAPLLVLVLP